MVYNNNKIVRSNEIHIGTLTLSNSLQRAKKDSHNVPEIIADYVYSATENLQKYLLRKKINYFVVMGTDIKKLSLLFGDLNSGFSDRAFNDIYDRLIKGDRQFKSILDKEMLEYDDLLIAMSIYSAFKTHTDADCALVPNVTLRDGILRALVDDTFSYSRKLMCTEDIIKSAKQLAKRYHSTTSHINQVDKFVVKIFDVYKKQEKFTEKDLLLLRLAACLHETGKFARQDDYNQATKMVIVNASLLGVTRLMLEEVAEIVDYFAIVSQAHANLTVEGKIDTRIVKLALILSVADALDKSKRSRLMIKSIKMTESKLRIKVASQSSFYVEKNEIASLNEIYRAVHAQNLIVEE